jgi:iron(III) transport system ATP-binding protein
MNDLRVDGLHLAYGSTPILRGVSLALHSGEVVALLGASGSGKTTLLRAVAGLELPSRGRIEIGGAVVFDAAAGLDLPAERRGLGMVFQSYALWPHRTVAENVAYALRLRGVSPAEAARRVDAALASLELGALAGRHPHQLSGGQQQRVAIARALVYDPAVILLDEPLSNLDAKLREEARAWLRELIVTRRLSALLVTHDQAEALAMSDRILLLRNGAIEQEGTPEELYRRPRTLYAAEFMGANARLQGRVAERRGDRVRVEGPGWSLWGERSGAVEPGDAAVGVMRLERIGLGEARPGEGVEAQLATAMFVGDRWEHLFHLGETRLRCYAPDRLPAGRHRLRLPAEDLWVFPAPAAP